MRTFLTAYWKNLIFANYEADVSVLQPYLPIGTEPDVYNGKCIVSLVGFMFLNTKLLGIGFPFHRNFEEFNLRFYVRRKVGDSYQRGVVFVKEIVPRRMITYIAYGLYGERYYYHPMRNHIVETGKDMEVSYSLLVNKQWNTIEVKASKESSLMIKGSEEEFIAEHYWGYTKLAHGKTSEYRVQHPQWKLHDIKSYYINIDIRTLYGEQWLPFLSGKPSSVFMAAGSPVSILTRNVLNNSI